MKYFKIILFITFIVIISYFTLFLATDYQTPHGRANLPFILWIIDIILLFIHEAGHYFFGIFGKFIHFLGGTLLQILIPIAAVIVFARNSKRSLPFTLYWTGHSVINVSIYIGDAPYRKLKLISSGAVHDWHWIFQKLDMMEYAETIAGVVNVFGILVCIAGIITGLIIVFFDIRASINPSYYSIGNDRDD